jgi:hypothetical protein
MCWVRISVVTPASVLEVFVGSIRQTLEQYLNKTTTVSFQILSSSSFLIINPFEADY